MAEEIVKGAIKVRKDNVFVKFHPETERSKITDLDQAVNVIVKNDCVASTTSNGLMSKEDKHKLDGIAEGATATPATQVKGNSETFFRTGRVNIAPENIDKLLPTINSLQLQRDNIPYFKNEQTLKNSPLGNLIKQIISADESRSISDILGVDGSVNVSQYAADMLTPEEKKKRIDMGCFAAANRAVYRGKDITKQYKDGTLFKHIADGTFQDIYPGDYIRQTVRMNDQTVDDCKWLVADLDYYYGDLDCQTHHIVLILLNNDFGKERLCAPDDKNGYINTELWAHRIPLKYTPGIIDAFGNDHILEHNEYLVTEPGGGNNGRGGLGMTMRNIVYFLEHSTEFVKRPVKVNIPVEVQITGYPWLATSAFDNMYNSQFAAFGFDKELMYMTNPDTGKRFRYWTSTTALPNKPTNYFGSTFPPITDNPTADEMQSTAVLGTKYFASLRPYFCLY